MSIRVVLAAAASLAMLLVSPCAAAGNPEIEPNNTKAAATVCDSGGLGMDALDFITGNTTGTLSTTGAASSDYFLIKTKARPLGIYRYRLSFTSAIAGHTISIRGLTQTNGVVNAGTDASLQTHSTTIIANARTVQWYGFGKQEQVYVKVTGATTTTADYVGTLSVDPVTPLTVTGSIVDGNVTIREDASTSAGADTDFFLYDSNLTAVPGALNDNPDTQGLVRSIGDGTYFVAWGLFNTCNDLPSPADDANRSGSVLDFPNAVVNSSVTSIANHAISIISDAGTATGSYPRTGAYDVNFVRLDIGVNTIPMPPTCIASITPTTLLNDGTGTYTITVNLTPGRRPLSTSHRVTANLSALRDPRPQPVAFTEVSPNVFTLSGTVGVGTAGGPYQIAVNVLETAPQARSSTCSVDLSVITPPLGACCTNDGCLILSQRECTLQGGSYRGDATQCSGCTCAATQPPANASCAGAVTLAIGQSVGANTCAAPVQAAPTCAGLSTSGGGLWYKFTGNGNVITVDTCASPALTRFDARLSVYCGTCNNFTCVASNDTGPCGALQASVNVCTQNGAVYYVLVHNGSGGGGDFILTLTDNNASCTPSVVCIPTGACCIPGSPCREVIASQCTTLGGTFLGVGTTCVTRSETAAFRSNNTPVPIPDASSSGPGSAQATITIGPGNGTIRNLRVAVGLTHTYAGDLTGILSKNNAAASVILFTREGGAPNLGGTYTFADNGLTRLGGTGLSGANDVIPSGAYYPATAMSDLDGIAYEGIWTLRVLDESSLDVGRIESFAFVSIVETPNCPSCSPCAADYNRDGGVDGADIASFFPDWANAVSCADVNGDGGVDGSDIEAFFTVWQRGGC
jgi:subtilisin-like proprotein convertase family protein